jgi:pyruvate formate lyase activating enzyme
VPACSSPPAEAAAALRIGGLQRFTSIDYPGALAAVVFVQGCAWRCVYCHNPQLQGRQPAPGIPRWAEVHDWLLTRRGLLDAVVFSGGEPTLDPALPAALDAVRAMGFRTGLHTAGMTPRRLQAVLSSLDWVGLDIKAPLHDGGERHDRITGVRGAAAAVARSLALLMQSGVALQLRTTVHPQWISADEVQTLRQELARLGAPDTVVQPGQPPVRAELAHALAAH